MKAIETYYNGNRFRSRLEARWAVVMDTLNVGYRYELEGYELADGLRYLPDFYIPSWDSFLEIKPVLPSDEEIRKAKGLAHESGKRVFMLIGEPRVVRQDTYGVTQWSKKYDAWLWFPDAGQWRPTYRWCGCPEHMGELWPYGVCFCCDKDIAWEFAAGVRTWKNVDDAFSIAASMRFEFRQESQHDVA